MRTEHFELFAEFENQHWWFVGRQRIVHGLLEELGIPAGSTVVDLGCGTGANIASLSPTYRAVGIDPSPEAIELARSRFPNVVFICGSVSSASAAAHFGASHAVILMDVLEHVEDDFGLTAELVGKMRVGAYLVVTVPANPRLWSPHDVSVGHQRRYDPTRLAAVWEGLPVSVRFLSHFNARLYPIVRGVRLWNRWWHTTTGRAETDNRRHGRLANWVLTRVFAGEGPKLRRALRRGGPVPYARGVSLVAVLQVTSLAAPQNPAPQIIDQRQTVCS